MIIIMRPIENVTKVSELELKFKWASFSLAQKTIVMIIFFMFNFCILSLWSLISWYFCSHTIIISYTLCFLWRITLCIYTLYLLIFNKPRFIWIYLCIILTPKKVFGDTNIRNIRNKYRNIGNIRKNRILSETKRKHGTTFSVSV